MVSFQFNTRFGIYLYILALVILFSTGSETGLMGGNEQNNSTSGVVRYLPASR